jgi:hypothetical protein
VKLWTRLVIVIFIGGVPVFAIPAGPRAASPPLLLRSTLGFWHKQQDLFSFGTT